MVDRLPAGAADEGGAPAALSCDEVSVSFGALRALSDVSLSFPRGGLHVVVGQNGAGKSTLARVFAGLVAPDHGRVHVAGREIPTGDVSASRRAGLEMVHQSFTLPPSMTVAEALELFDTRPRRTPYYRRRALEAQWHDDLERTGLDIDPRARIRDLPIETLQAVEITRALAADADVLLLDEPTAVLSPAAVEALFARLRGLRDRGVTVITILHKLREVAALAETVAVLRDGRVTLPPTSLADTDDRELSAHIVGEQRRYVSVGPAHGEAAVAVAVAGDASALVSDDLLEVAGVATQASATEPALVDVSVRVRRSEIVGVAGVEGNGQRALVGVITGLQPATAGSMTLHGDDVTAGAASQRRAAGLRVIPFDRNTQGISQSSPLWHNVSVLGVLLGRWRRRRLLQLGRLRRQSAAALDQWQVRYSDIDQLAGGLSGGNVQRLIIARELSAGLTLLIAAQPTRGLDLVATEFVRRTLGDLRASGAGVLLVSSDLDELFELSDRLLVMSGGRIVAEFAPPFELERVGAAMVGATDGETAGNADGVNEAVGAAGVVR